MKPDTPKHAAPKSTTSKDWHKAKSLLADMESTDTEFNLQSLPIERLNIGEPSVAEDAVKAICITCDEKDVCETCDALDCYTDDDEDPDDDDVCITCDAPRDTCDQCDMTDCIICDAPNDTECQTAQDKCQWCTMADPGAPADAG